MSEDLDLDKILEAIKGPSGGAGGGGMDMATLMVMQMQNDRADRAASRQMMMQLVTAIAPLLLPMLMQKKEADPILMTVLSSVLGKQNDGAQLQQFMQMMSAATNMSMEQMKTSMLGIMELKDQQTKKMLEERGEDDGDGGSPAAAIMREVRLGLGAVVGMLPSAQPQPQPAQVTMHPPAALPAPGSSPARPAGQRPPPVVVVLHQLQAIQSGKVKESPASWAALSTVALQDDALLTALDDCTDEDLQPLFQYCLPHLQVKAADGSQPLLTWVQQDGVATWIDDRVRRKLLPLIDAARDDGEGDGEAAPDAPVDGMHPMPNPADVGTEPEVLQPEAAGA